MTGCRILVLGAGPAGAAVALGLRRLGYPVSLVSEWRRFKALEGVSVRVLEALRGAGLHHALMDATLPSQRQVIWNGQQHAQNVEFLWTGKPSIKGCGKICAWLAST